MSDEKVTITDAGEANGARPCNGAWTDQFYREGAIELRTMAARPIDWAAWKAREPPPKLWRMQDWLGDEATLFAGTGGVGKSLVAQTLATALATGREFIPGAPAAQPLKVLMWMCEDDEHELVRRQLAILKHFGLSLDDMEGKLIVEPRRGRNNTLMELAYGRPEFTSEYLLLREQVNDLGIDVLFADNNGQMYGGNESDRHQVTQYVNGMQGLVHGRPFTPVLIGHIARAQGSEFSGNAAWENACRMRWFLDHWLPGEKPEKPTEPVPTEPIYLCKRKTNYSTRDYRRLYWREGLFVPQAHPTGQRFDTKAREELADAIVLKGLPRIVQMGKHATEAQTSTYYLPRQLIAHKLHEGHTTKELAAAMNRLMTAGRLKVAVVGKNSNRMDKRGLVSTDPPPTEAEPDADIPF